MLGCVLGAHPAVRLVPVAAPRELLPLEAQAVLCADRLEHAHAFGDHLAPDAVSGDDRDEVLFHVAQYIELVMRFAALESSTEWCGVALWRDGEIAAVERRAGQPAFRARVADAARPSREILDRRRGSSTRWPSAPGPDHSPACASLAGSLRASRSRAASRCSASPRSRRWREESGAERVIACLDARMREVYYAALERQAQGWREVVPARCVAPERARRAGRKLGRRRQRLRAFTETWDSRKCCLKCIPPRLRVAQLAAPRLAAGEGVDAALAQPVYIRDKVALDQGRARAMSAVLKPAPRLELMREEDLDEVLAIENVDLHAPLDARQLRRFAARRLRLPHVAPRQASSSATSC